MANHSVNNYSMQMQMHMLLLLILLILLLLLYRTGTMWSVQAHHKPQFHRNCTTPDPKELNFFFSVSLCLNNCFLCALAFGFKLSYLPLETTLASAPPASFSPIDPRITILPILPESILSLLGYVRRSRKPPLVLY